VIDEHWEDAGDRGGGEVGIDAVLLGELLDELAAEYLLDLLRRNGKILTTTHPGLEDMAKAGAFELLEQTTQSLTGAMVRDERAGEAREDLRFVAATEDGTEKRIEKAHGK
jgi:hypothetical protein